jgi:hypothetical protein
MFSHDVKRQASPSWIYAPAITSIMYETFEVTPFKRNYDAAFGQIANILRRYGIIEHPRNLRFRFTLQSALHE